MGCVALTVTSGGDVTLGGDIYIGVGASTPGGPAGREVTPTILAMWHGMFLRTSLLDSEV